MAEKYIYNNNYEKIYPDSEKIKYLRKTAVLRYF